MFKPYIYICMSMFLIRFVDTILAKTFHLVYLSRVT